MLFSSHFLLGLGALINIATAAPSHRALVARLEGVADDDCNAAWLGDSVADGKAWDKTDNNNVDPYFCSTRWKQGAVVVGIKIWNDKGKLPPFFWFGFLARICKYINRGREIC
jgi:hypothetical protein